MNFEAPESADLENLETLNREYLRLLAGGAGDSVAFPRILSLRYEQQRRLSTIPIMLMSVSENDASAWAALEEPEEAADLFESKSGRYDAALRDLGVQVISFAWHLAQDKRYTLRLFFNASPEWTEMIAAARLLDVVDFVRRRPELIRLRESSNSNFWDKLLVAGIGRNEASRRSAHISALQKLHTRPAAAADAAVWPVAACSRRPARMRVANRVSDKE